YKEFMARGTDGVTPGVGRAFRGDDEGLRTGVEDPGGGRNAAGAVGDHPQQRVIGLDAVGTRGELRVICDDVLGADDDRVELEALTVGPLEGLGAANPARVAAARCEPAVQGRGVLDDDEGQAGAAVLEERLVQLRRLGGAVAQLYSDAGVS